MPTDLSVGCSAWPLVGAVLTVKCRAPNSFIRDSIDELWEKRCVQCGKKQGEDKESEDQGLGEESREAG